MGECVRDSRTSYTHVQVIVLTADRFRRAKRSSTYSSDAIMKCPSRTWIIIINLTLSRKYARGPRGAGAAGGCLWGNSGCCPSVAAAAAVVPRGPRDTPRFPRFRKASAAATTQPTTNTTRVNTAETRVNGSKSTESLVVEFRGAAARPAAPLPAPQHRCRC